MKTELALTAAAGLVSYIAWQLLRVSTVAFESDFACDCGQVQGRVHTSAGLHIVCYCDDCQAFANTLCAKEGRKAPSPLDEHGGTDLIQVFPADLVFTRGQEHVEIGKLSDKSTLLRVHASCCHTPLFNTMDDFAFLGLLTSTLRSPDVNLGAPQYRIMAKFAKNANTLHAAHPNAVSIVPVGFVLAFFARSLFWHRKKAHPSPLDASMRRAPLA
ncbi:Aste57867_23947 [Aphanomyces stellatus]|uniref:Aste57867_23947 protein n=1 Tax=Aphanomyces stellatus TaxID=120398 RepID=A0A485LP33_9STRA|nr:hypothetical protein As57867_023874 [Aphanomyces stellatus]VFU00590.1 Aste57867_23947 [Aphanomyces stellatus]